MNTGDNNSDRDWQRIWSLPVFQLLVNFGSMHDPCTYIGGPTSNRNCIYHQLPAGESRRT